MNKSGISRLAVTASAAIGISVLSSAAYALDVCADSFGINQVVTNTCTVNSSGPGPCSGTPGNDVIFGSAGNDVIKAKEGNDLVVGFGGNDIICLDSGNDFADGGDGGNVIRAGAGNDVVITAGGFAFPGSAFGGSGVDILMSDFGFHSLGGGSGNDSLVDLDGGSVLDGGPGTDSCVIVAGNTLIRCELPPPP